MPNTVCHIEYNTTDLDRAQGFYESLFGWSFQPFGDRMRTFSHDGQHVGALLKVETVMAGDSPSVWFDVADIDATLAQAESLGGRVTMPKDKVPNVGWCGVALDLDGNAIGLVQFESSQAGRE